MMLGEAVSKALYDKSIKELTIYQIEKCNNFIDDYNEVKELMESDLINP